MPERIIAVRSRRAEVGLRIQAAQHGLAGLLLLLAGMDTMRGTEGSPLLAAGEILSGAVLLVLVLLELRGRHHAPAPAVNWVGLFAGLAIFVEGIKLTHEGRHHVQYAYFVAALIMICVALFFSRIRRTRRLELRDTGLLFRGSRLRALRLTWDEISNVEVRQEGFTLTTSTGKECRIDLRDAINAGEIGSALAESLERRARSGIAISRGVSPRISECELSYAERAPISAERAALQHRAYEESLSSLGFRLQRLPAEPNLPDCVFIEDTAVVLDELAVITRPGAESRRPEIAAVIQALRPFRKLASIEAPGILDGGDVLQVGRRIFVGCSARTNGAGREQLRSLLAPFGYSVEEVPLRGCLHLKSAVTLVAENTLLIHPGWVDRASFPGMSFIEADPSEPMGANALHLGDAVLYPGAFPATRKRLEERGIRVRTVEVDELAKAEGGVTCCSLLLRNRAAGAAGAREHGGNNP